MSSKSRTFKSRTFQKNVLFKNLHFSKTQFSKTCTFQKLNFQNLAFSKTRFSKSRFFKNSLFQNSYFFRIPCLFQNFRVFKNSPFKVHLEFLTKIPWFFQKFPLWEKLIFTNSVFFSKNSVFYKIPRFSDFLNL